jgi:hypothetical protein
MEYTSKHVDMYLCVLVYMRTCLLIYLPVCPV